MTEFNGRQFERFHVTKIIACLEEMRHTLNQVNDVQHSSVRAVREPWCLLIQKSMVQKRTVESTEGELQWGELEV